MSHCCCHQSRPSDKFLQALLGTTRLVINLEFRKVSEPKYVSVKTFFEHNPKL